MIRTYFALAAGFALLLWLVWIWFGLADSSVFHLLGSAVLAIVVIMGAGVLLALAFGRLRDWPRFVAFVLLAVILAALVEWLRAYAPQVGDWAAVRLTRIRGSAVNPRTMDTIYVWKLWISWALVLALALPVVLRCARLLGNWRYWALLAGFAVALFIARTVVWWIPNAGSLRLEFVSMGVRFALAWLFSVAALQAFAVSTTREASRISAPVPVPQREE